MIVCICKNISSSMIENKLNHGDTLQNIAEQLQIGKECRKCVHYFYMEFDKYNKEEIVNVERPA